MQIPCKARQGSNALASRAPVRPVAIHDAAKRLRGGMRGHAVALPAPKLLRFKMAVHKLAEDQCTSWHLGWSLTSLFALARVSEQL